MTMFTSELRLYAVRIRKHHVHPRAVPPRLAGNRRFSELPDGNEKNGDESEQPDQRGFANKAEETASGTRQIRAEHKFQTLAQRDEALKAALEDRSGEGGAAGLELENGEPVAMKRGVKSNMFRYI